MSSAPFAATVELAPRPSIRALTFLFALHGVIGVLLLLALPRGGLMALGAGLLAISWMALRRHPVFGFGPRALVRLTWHAEGGWTLHESGGATYDAALRGDSLVQPWLLVLNFERADGGRRTRAILGDEVPEEQLRRLRARLKAGDRK
jgi:toxin CptA